MGLRSAESQTSLKFSKTQLFQNVNVKNSKLKARNFKANSNIPTRLITGAAACAKRLRYIKFSFRQHSSATLTHDPATQRRTEKTPPPWPHVVQRPEQSRWCAPGCPGTAWSTQANTRTMIWDSQGHFWASWSARVGPLGWHQPTNKLRPSPHSIHMHQNEGPRKTY